MKSAGRTSLPQAIRRQLVVKPLPKNMLPGRHDGRRSARAIDLHEKYKNNHFVTYVDAAKQNDQWYTVSVVTGGGQITNTASVHVPSAVEAEETAIALAMTSASTRTILSDSKRAIINFSKGSINNRAARILKNCQPDKPIELVWVPAHSGNPGNEEAHRVARGLTNREARLSDPDFPGEAPTSFNDITNFYKSDRRIYPSPDEDLTRAQATILRRIQTYSFLGPHRLALITCGSVNPICQNCSAQELATQNHVLCGCDGFSPPKMLLLARSRSAWEELIKTPIKEKQLAIAAWAERVAARVEPP